MRVYTHSRTVCIVYTYWRVCVLRVWASAAGRMGMTCKTYGSAPTSAESKLYVGHIYIYIYSVLWQRCADTIKQTDPQKDELSRRETQFMTLPGKAMHAGTECLWCRYDICVSVYNRRTH